MFIVCGLQCPVHTAIPTIAYVMGNASIIGVELLYELGLEVIPCARLGHQLVIAAQKKIVGQIRNVVNGILYLVHDVGILVLGVWIITIKVFDIVLGEIAFGLGTNDKDSINEGTELSH